MEGERRELKHECRCWLATRWHGCATVRDGVVAGWQMVTVEGQRSGILRDFLATKVTERGTESFGLIKNENTTSKY